MDEEEISEEDIRLIENGLYSYIKNHPYRVLKDEDKIKIYKEYILYYYGN